MTEVALTDALNNTPADGENDLTDYVAALVGPGKKYKSVADLAKGYLNADLHIRELRDKLDDRTGQDQLIQEALSTLRKPSTPADAEPPPAPNANPSSAKPEQVVSVEAISTVVEKTLEQKEYARVVQSNVDKSWQLLTEKYGGREQAIAAVKTFIGTDPSLKKLVDDASKSNPDACARLILGSVPPTSPAQNTPGVDKKGLNATVIPADGKLTYAVCQQIRKENPKLYKSPEFRAKMEKAAADAMARGVDFFAN